MHYNFIFHLFILTLVLPTRRLQQIFESSESCEFIKKGDEGKNSIYLKSKSWEVRDGPIRQMKNKRYFVAPCGNVSPLYGCTPGVAACIVNAKNPKKSVLNGGKYFVHQYDAENEKNILRSVNGQPCSSAENFTVIVELNCGANVKETPKFLYEDECELRLEMISADCKPSCTTQIDGNLIDLRPLRKLGGIQIQDPAKNKSFIISFCGDAEGCGTGILMCEAGTVVPIADTKTLSIAYNDNKHKNGLVLKGHHGSGKQSRLNAEVHLKCNWATQGISNLKYIAPKIQGRTYKFEGESSMACIKMPMNCMVIDSFNNYIVYDLKILNKVYGWSVGNITSGTISINMCGPLRLPSEKNICTEQASQVCFKNGQGESFNLGSIATNFHVTDDDTVKASFTDGSPCTTNSSVSYKTEIELICSKKESSPILQSDANCTYTINWRTPAACPKNIATQDNCLMSDLNGNINLRSISKSTDTIHNLSPNSYLRYNLCGTLNTACNKLNHTSICFINNGKEHVAGYTSNVLLRYNKLLSLNLIGDQCGDSRSRSETKVYFTCNYLAPISGKVEVKIVKDNCNFELHVQTPLACVRPITAECRFYTRDSMYDLTPLMRNVTNYIVQDAADQSVVYVLNVCHSIVNTNDLFCPVNSGACVKNLAEPHLRRMYTSIGTIQEKSILDLENDNLVFSYSLGSLCRAELIHYSTKIQFECSTKEEGPKFLSKTACSFKFVWRTPNACPKRLLTLKTRRSISNNCVYKHPVFEDQDLDFNGIDKDLILPFDTGEYIINICEKNYSVCTQNDTECTSISSSMKLLNDDSGIFLQCLLISVCDEDWKANILHIQLVCDPLLKSEVFEIIKISNCTLYIKLTSSSICQKQIYLNPLNNKEILSTSTTVSEKHISTSTFLNHATLESSEKPHNLILKKTLDCYIQSASGNFNLENINFHTSTTEHNYSLAFGEDVSYCSGFICINGTEYLQRSETKCPSVSLSEEAPVIKLMFLSHQVCEIGKISLEVWLKCNSTPEESSTLKESPCTIVITYPTKEACSLLKNVELYNSSSIGMTAISVSFGMGLFLSMIVVGIGIKRLCTWNIKAGYKSIGSKKHTPIYYKDSTA